MKNQIKSPLLLAFAISPAFAMQSCQPAPVKLTETAVVEKGLLSIFSFALS